MNVACDKWNAPIISPSFLLKLNRYRDVSYFWKMLAVFLKYLFISFLESFWFLLTANLNVYKV